MPRTDAIDIGAERSVQLPGFTPPRRRVNFLALDTSSVACTVALRTGDEFIVRHQEQAREHTRLLMPMIRESLLEAGTGLAELDAIVLGNGPGSFIGMRIAASVAQGLAHGAGLKIIPVSSLAAIAAEVFATTNAEEAVVAQDAHMNEVYLGIFARDENGLPGPVCEERLHGQVAIAELAENGKTCRVAAGYGWRRYPSLMNINRSLFDDESSVLYPQARYLLPLAKMADALPPQNIEPAYLRRNVAQIPETARK